MAMSTPLQVVPELADVPDQHVQEPWGYEFADRIIGRIYPERVVDLKTSTAVAQDRIYCAGQRLCFHAAADAIQAKHGSRKSNISMTGRRAKEVAPKSRSALKKNRGQTEFER
jgi:deoxyribodipyrimidine photo-lyase